MYIIMYMYSTCIYSHADVYTYINIHIFIHIYIHYMGPGDICESGKGFVGGGARGGIPSAIHFAGARQ